MKKISVSRSIDLNEIFYKCQALRTANIDQSLLEGSLSALLVEELDASDVSKVSDAIKKGNDQIDDIFKYLDSLENFDRSKIGTLETYLDTLKDALKTAQGQLASANFETGAVSKFLGQKLTLPQILQASISIHTKAQDFLNGFSSAVDNIVKNLKPLVDNDSDKNKALKDLAGQGGFPDEKKLRDGINKAMKSALGGGFFNKVKSFFSKAMTGAEKKIMDSIPTMNVDVIADEISEAFMDSTIESFEKAKAPKPSDSDALETIAQETQKAEEEATEQSEETSTPSSGDSPAPLENEKEAEKEQDTAQKQLVSSIKDEADEPQSPKDASFNALDAWADGLSKSSQDSIRAAGRLDNLKDLVGTALDDSAKAVESEVASAIEAWRAENEETLIKGKRFAKKNFDSLQNLIPKLAASMLKKANESTLKMTRQLVKRVVYEFLDRKFYKNTDNLLSEYNYTEDNMRAYRLNKLAGLE